MRLVAWAVDHLMSKLIARGSCKAGNLPDVILHAYAKERTEERKLQIEEKSERFQAETAAWRAADAERHRRRNVVALAVIVFLAAGATGLAKGMGLLWIIAWPAVGLIALVLIWRAEGIPPGRVTPEKEQ